MILKKLILILLPLTIFIQCSSSNKVTTLRQPSDKTVSLMSKVADWQLKNLEVTIDVWAEAVFYVGLAELYNITKDISYYNALQKWADKMDWAPGQNIRHADDQSAGQVYLELYFLEKKEEKISAIQNTFDRIISPENNGQEEWYWCDALFMAPPALAGLTEATGNDKYIDYMDRLWWETTDFLYDEESNLFYRDQRFIPELNDTLDRKIFWSRGNGWVLAGLVRVLKYMPEDYKNRERYIDLFREMAAKVVSLQPEDGLWRTDLLRPDRYPEPETSGTGLFTYALAWGINNGILDKDKYITAVTKSWRGLSEAVFPNGKLGYVQSIDYKPNPVEWDNTEQYGAGAFMLAGSEIYKLNEAAYAGGTTYPSITDDGAWCWFADPRGMQFKGKFNKTYAGWVTSAGDIQAGSYDHDRQVVTHVTLHEKLNVDDHANPAMIVRPDGRVMIFYSAHNGGKMYYRKTKAPENIIFWEDEQELEKNTEGPMGFTYPNAAQLADEDDKIYLFWRGANWQPTFVTSPDGENWSDVNVLFGNSDARPYVKYSYTDSRINIAYTNAHPYETENNSIYFVYYENGEIRRADGSKIVDMDKVPFGHEEGSLVYDSQKTGVKAWIWDVASFEDGTPVMVYATFPDSQNHDYYYAWYNGTEWENNKITDAGGWFPEAGPGDPDFEPYYSGGVVLDHNDPSVVYLSRPHNDIFEIERWETGDKGKTWKRKQVTIGSLENNVRPFVPRNSDESGFSVMWMSGKYFNYKDYHTEIKIKQNEE